MLFAHPLIAVEDDKPWVMSFSFGAAYSTMYPEISIFKNNRNPKIQKALGLNLEYHISDKRYIGLGFTRHEGSYNLDDEIILGQYPVGVRLDNYRQTWAYDYFELSYRRSFDNRLNLTAGFFYYLDYTNFSVVTARYEPNILFVFGRDKPRSDDFGLSLALGYSLPLRDYMKLGLRSKLYYTLAGIESISLAPYISFSF